MGNNNHAKSEAASDQEALKKAHQQYVASGGKPMPNLDDLKPNERLHHCEYYLLADSIPVVFLVSHEGNRYGARRPGDTPGSLKPDVSLISKFEKDPIDFTPIGEEEFKQRLRDYVRRPPVIDSKGR